VNALCDPEQLIADPSDRLQARDDDPSHEPIRDHAPLGLLRPDLVVLIRRDELVEPHATVDRHGQEQHAASPTMKEVVVLIRERREEDG
jgi:hypothetical protein